MSTSPDWSIVIPTHARGARLADTLAALAHLDAPPGSFEVVIVDDGSPDPVRLPELDLELRLVRQPRSGPALARNRGAREARSPGLIFLDDDCAPEPGWLREITARVTPGTAIGGSVRNGFRGNLFAEASELLLREFIFAQYSPESTSFEFLPTANLAASTEAFWQVEGFDEGFRHAAAEDREFCRRWRQRGYRFQLAPAAIVYHFHDLRWRDFWRQQYRYGQGSGLYYKIHSQAPRTSRHFYLRLFRAAFESGAIRAPALGGLLAVSQVATMMGYFSRPEVAR